MKSALEGKVICITRSIEQAEKSAELVKKRGGIPFLFPVIKQVPINLGKSEKNILKNLDSYNYLIFTSANALKFFALALEKVGLVPNEIKAEIVCVGPQTAAKASVLGLETTLLPNEFLGTSLIEVIKKSIPSESKLLYPRPKKVSHDLKKELEPYGYSVDEIIIYETVPDDSFVDRVIRAFEAKEIDAVTFTSGSTVKYFVELLKEKIDLEQALEGVLVAVIGPSTEKAAQKYGIRVDIVPEEYTFIGILDALEKAFSDL
jgi:uroporphyrinogen-III synthase